MKIKLTLKSPDGIECSIDEAARNLKPIDAEEEMEDRRQRVRDAIRPWVKYGEYVSIEIDTEKDTAKVLPS